MINANQLDDVIGATAYDRDGDKLGRIGHVYFDDETDQPKWVTVNTGLFGTAENFVPIQGAELGTDRVVLAVEKAVVKDAPNIADDGRLSPEEERELYRHYGLEYDGGTADVQDAGVADRTGTTVDRDTDRGFDRDVDRDTDRFTDRDRDGGVREGAVGRDTSGPTTDEAMTRSEERLNVGTETRETGRARLRKHVVTERQQVEVPVSHEELRVEREPITDGNRGEAYDGPELSDEEHEVTLRAERPVVSKETEAVERVRLGTETHRGTETVEEDVRREEIDLDEDVRGTDRSRPDAR